MTAKEFQKYAGMLFSGEALPDDVNLASRNPEGGDTLAHVAAMHGMLPHDFDNWALRAIPHGETVAHIAAANGTLPPDFDQWHLADISGQIVGHVAVEMYRFPDDFK